MEDNRETFDHSDTIQEERILTFMESMGGSNTPFLQEKEREALAEDIPIIREQTQSLIRFLLELRHPKNILEVGAATGFSSLFLRTYADKDAKITTIERDPERAERARLHYREAGEAGVFQGTSGITLLEGDAADILKTLEGEYDFLFMDAAKGQYGNFLPEVLRLLSPGGLLLSDNIFKDGEILESRFAVKRRDRTIHRRMRDYLYQLTHDERLQTLLLQEGDGAALSVRKSNS
ncbi:MAG: O-methyltransferase [Lachnospiraceae bacterium]|nr:O-methyltransferase [Lachnospiraceae bacterium]